MITNKPFRIGIIGSENSHAKEFTNLFNNPDKDGVLIYPDCRVTLVWGHYPEENERLVKEFGAERVAESMAEMVENVDAVMITARDGRFHAEFARPFIEAGIPAFIDKPFTCDPKEAAALIRLAKEKGVPLCGGSALKHAEDILALKDMVKTLGKGVKGGFIAAPLDFYSVYNGFWFYSAHAAEMCLETFGWNPKSVYAKEQNGSVQALVNYEDFSVSCSFVNGGSQVYTGILFAPDYTERRAISLEGIFQAECSTFVEMLCTGKMRHSYEQLIAPVFLLDAIQRSYETGEQIEIIQEKI